MNNTSNEQHDQSQGEQDEGKHVLNGEGQGDQGEHEQQCEEVATTYLLNIHTSNHQSNPSCFNLNLNTTQHYYVYMFHNPPMTEDRAKENMVINLNNLLVKNK
jgi:hypothetical protein